MCAKRYHRAATEPFTSVYVKAPFAYIVCVRGMGNLVEHWFGLPFTIHADNNTDAESQACVHLPVTGTPWQRQRPPQLLGRLYLRMNLAPVRLGINHVLGMRLPALVAECAFVCNH